MNTILLLHHHVAAALHSPCSSPSPSHSTTTLSPPITLIRNSKPLRAQGRGFGSGSGSGSDAKKNEIKIKEQDNNKDEDDDDDDDEIPQVVFDRMLRRVAATVGAPMAAGVGAVCALELLKRGGVWAAPAWVPFVATILAFGTSAFGIAYGTLSTSWDPERDGSPLGWDEARRNWPRLWKDEAAEKKTSTRS